MKKLSIAALKKKYPKLHLHYHDNSAWTLYKEPPPEDTCVGETEHDKLILLEGDEGFSDGYIPDIVSILCEGLGISTDSE